MTTRSTAESTVELRAAECGSRPADRRVGRASWVEHRRRVVADHVSRVLVLPARLHEAEDQALVDVVLAPLLGIDRAVVEALIGDVLLVLDADRRSRESG